MWVLDSFVNIFQTIISWSIKIFIVFAVGVVVYMIFNLFQRNLNWRNNYKERMQTVLRRTGLLIKEEKRTILPSLESLEYIDNNVVFIYRLIPGMSLDQFISKRQFFEAAFDADVSVEGTGNRLVININRNPLSTTLPR